MHICAWICVDEWNDKIGIIEHDIVPGFAFATYVSQVSRMFTK